MRFEGKSAVARAFGRGLFALACAALATGAMAAPRLLGNVNALGNPDAGFRSIGSAPPVVLANRYYVFAADDGAFGSEPWVLDLVNGLTRRLGDLNPGNAGSSPSDFAVAGTRVVFTAFTPESGRELWATDGTPAGTVLVADIHPGPASALIAALAPTTNNRVVFAANDGSSGSEIWLSDGTTAGTALAYDLVPGANGSSPSQFTTIGARLFFTAYNDAQGRELWLWDVNGIGVVADIAPGTASSSPNELTAVGSSLVFRACRPSEGCEPWRSDGTAAGTTLFADIRTGSTGSDPFHFTWHAGLARLFFDADDGVNGRELWQLTSAGVATRVSNLVSGSGGSDFQGSAVLGAKLLFVADANLAGARLYSWDGATVTLVKILSTAGAGFVDHFLVWNGRLHFEELGCWSSDGTAAGTSVWDADCGAGGGFVVGAGRLLYGSYGDFEREIWSLSTTGAIVKESEFSDFSSNPDRFAFRPAGAAFRANGGSTGAELVVENAAAGTWNVVDIAPGADDSDPDGMTAWQGAFWFAARTATTGTDLWRSDGSVPGTQAVELAVGNDSPYPQELTRLGNDLYLSAYDYSLGQQLYRLTGNGPTIDLLDYAGEYGLSPWGLVTANGRLFFAGESDSRGTELFVVDATATAPTPIEIIPGVESPEFIDDLVSWNNAAWFVARIEPALAGGLGTDQVYRSDGVSVARVGSLAENADPRNLVGGAGGVWFLAYEAATGSELWRTDGSISGRVTDLAAGSSDPDIGEMTVAGDRLYFVADDGINGYELWTIDAALTLKRADLVAGNNGSNPRDLVAIGQQVVFSADDGVHGRELWIADASGARLLAETWPGVGSGAPESIAADAFHDRVLYSAVAPLVWREPFEVDVPLFKNGFDASDAVPFVLVP
ncbi:MAG: hypothetical protein J0L88_15690 [Xanthomonadales bacterium]|nr:hypothetical protein [Xanthomonadales bacterium]